MLLAQKQIHKYMQQNREINPCIYYQLIYNKEPRIYNGGMDSLFNKQCWENWIVTCKRVKLDPYFIPDSKINSNWFKYLNIIPEIIKLLEENIEDKLLDFGLCSDFLDLTPQAKTTKAKVNKGDYIKLKSSCKTKGTINQIKRQPTEWEKISVNHISNNGLISKIYKERM